MRPQLFIGFLSSRRKLKRFASLATAVRVFHEQNDHFLVPFDFQVPKNNSSDNLWPEETRGLNLSRQIGAFIDISTTRSSPELLKIRHELDAVGFPDIRDWPRFLWTRRTLAALKTFKQIEGNLLVPTRFEVSKDDVKWPKSTWGLKLGYRLYDAIERFTATAEFLVIGTGGEDKKNAVENWPAELCGCLLGRVVNNIRSLSAHSEYVERDTEELKKLGFGMNDADQKWHEVVLLALQAYHRIHGHCNISQRFVVPEEEPWPQELWGMLLGFTAGNIRTKGSCFNQRLQDYEKLEEIGFVLDTFKAKWKDRFLPALEKYVHVYGDANVPAGFVGKSVAAGDAWTTAGEFVANEKQRRGLADFIAIDREKLDERGFFWRKIRSIR